MDNLGQAASLPGASAEPLPNATSSGFKSSAGMLHPSLTNLLATVQEAHVYNDSKTAVDLVLLQPPEDLAAAASFYLQLPGTAGAAESATAANTTAANPTNLAGFLGQYTAPAGSDLQMCSNGPPDWQPEPPGFLSNLQAANDTTDTNATALEADAAALRQFGLQIHERWNLLCRQVSPDVSAQPERHSLLPLPNQQVVPGDRFREVYYWDSYWVIRGLLVSGMTTSATALVDNLLTLLEQVGHVPNGARVYYLNRSQPPLLSAMVREVVEATNDTALLQRALPLLLKEHAYWTSPPKDVVVQGPNGSTYHLSRYYANWTAPRPESYREDAELGRTLAAAVGSGAAGTTAVPGGAGGAGGQGGAGGVGGPGTPGTAGSPGAAAAAEGAAVAAAGATAAGAGATAAGGTGPAAGAANAAARAAAAAARAAAAAGGAGTAGGPGSPGGAGGAGGPGGPVGAAAAGAPGTADSAGVVSQLYRDLASGAESGWDYSSRWFADGKDLITIQTTKVVPADLNALLFQMERNIAWAANRTGDATLAATFNDAAATRKAAIMALLWNQTTASWHDGILMEASTPSLPGAAANVSQNTSQQQQYTLVQNHGVFASNYVPLWTGLTQGDRAMGAAVVNSLNASRLVQLSGVATSLYPTGQQWDWPNGWPPLQHMLVEGASRYGGTPGDALAGRVAHAWVRNNMAIFNTTGHMHEKYDVTSAGQVGGGGEYVPQVGFGWSNGVVLTFLQDYFGRQQQQ